MCRPATARAITVGGTMLAVAAGLISWTSGSAVATYQTQSTVVTLAGGTAGSGHAGMPSAMPGMAMSEASDPGQGAYLEQTPHGSVRLSQRAGRLTGVITVSGLPPGSHHAEGLLGSAANCTAASRHSATVALALPLLVADAHGTARARIDLAVRGEVISPGYVITVDRDPTVGEIDRVGTVTSSPGPRRFTADPAVLCGRA